MELRVYSAAMEMIGVLDSFTSLIWTRKYIGPGEFELHAPITEENLLLLRRGNILRKSGAPEAGAIEGIHLEETEDTAEITATGRFLSCWLDRRVIRNQDVQKTNEFKPYRHSADVVSVIRRLVSGTGKQAAASPLFSAEDGITMAFRGYLPSGVSAIDSEVASTQADMELTGANLLETVQDLCRTAALGFRLRPAFENRTVTFELWRGTDKSASVAFSDRLDNLEKAVWEENEQTHKNVLYVLADKQTGGSETTEILMEYGKTALTGLARREGFMKTDVQRDEDESDAKYLPRVRQGAIDALAGEEYTLVQSMESEVLPDAGFVYGRDYDLGDVVRIYKRAWGVETTMRITEISEIYEDGIFRIAPTFGDPLPEKISFKQS